MKSAVGIGALLTQGIGDTIRVSLTEPPENEIPVARALIQTAALYPYTRNERENRPCLFRKYEAPTREALLLHMACDAGPLLLDGAAADFKMEAVINGRPLNGIQTEELSLSLLQATRVQFTKPEYIACPGCGRTLFDLQATLAAIRAGTSHLKGVKIAVMGCIVNGPGEMADADYGYVGAGPGKITLYKAKKPVKKAVPQEHAVEELLALIRTESE
jgi:(E)-4-hydroxy-3-methylbut-2-enyl-diphosphate synthase